MEENQIGVCEKAADWVMGVMGGRGAAAVGAKAKLGLGERVENGPGWDGKRDCVWAMENRRRCRWWGAEGSEQGT